MVRANRNLKLKDSLRVPTLKIGITAIILLLAVAIGIQILDGGAYHTAYPDNTGGTNFSPKLWLFGQLVIIAWSVATGVLMLAVVTARRRKSSKIRFLTISLVLTVLLAFNGALSLQETHGYFAGMAEKAVLGAYALALLIYFRQFRRALFRAPQVLLLLALLFMTISFTLGVVPQVTNFIDYDRALQVENGAKLIGILLWTMHYLLYASWLVARRKRSKRKRGHQAVARPLPAYRSNNREVYREAARQRG